MRNSEEVGGVMPALTRHALFARVVVDRES